MRCGILVYNCKYVVIDGLDFHHYTEYGVWLLDQADNVVVRNCRVWSCVIGIFNRGGDDALIEYNELFGNTAGIFISWRDSNANTPLRKEATGYPTQKPERLLERIVRASSLPGATVADLMCGSGTTLVAAANLGRRFVGADRSPAAIDIASKRLAAESVPVRMLG